MRSQTSFQASHAEKDPCGVQCTNFYTVAVLRHLPVAILSGGKFPDRADKSSGGHDLATQFSHKAQWHSVVPPRFILPSWQTKRIVICSVHCLSHNSWVHTQRKEVPTLQLSFTLESELRSCRFGCAKVGTPREVGGFDVLGMIDPPLKCYASAPPQNKHGLLLVPVNAN